MTMNKQVGATVGLLAIGGLAVIGVLAACGKDLRKSLKKADKMGILEKCDDLVSRLERESNQKAA